MVHMVVMAGGSGTRFWPESRKSRSKQFLNLTGGGRMIEETIRRVLPLVSRENIWIVAGKKDAAHLRPAPLGVPAENILLEPEGRNTAPAVALAAFTIFSRDKHAVIAALPADHAVSNEPAFRATLRKGLSLSGKSGRFVVIGIKPTHPATGYGYIERGAPLAKTAGVFHVARFTEKPGEAAARRFLASGKFAWNSGIFIVRADTFLSRLERFLPDISASMVRAFAAFGTRRFVPLLRAAYRAMPSVSVDYGILEKEQGSLVIPASFGWSDLGTWRSLHDFLSRDGGNVTFGNVLLSECSNVLVRSDRGVAAVMGMTDVVVVRNGDALLVCPKSRSEEVKAVVASVLRNHPELA